MPIRDTYIPPTGDRIFQVPLRYISGVFCPPIDYHFGSDFNSREWVSKSVSVIEMPTFVQGHVKITLTSFSDSTPTKVEIESLNCKFSITLNPQEHQINHLCE